MEVQAPALSNQLGSVIELSNLPTFGPPKPKVLGRGNVFARVLDGPRAGQMGMVVDGQGDPVQRLSLRRDSVGNFESGQHNIRNHEGVFTVATIVTTVTVDARSAAQWLHHTKAVADAQDAIQTASATGHGVNLETDDRISIFVPSGPDHDETLAALKRVAGAHGLGYNEPRPVLSHQINPAGKNTFEMIEAWVLSDEQNASVVKHYLGLEPHQTKGLNEEQRAYFVDGMLAITDTELRRSDSETWITRINRAIGRLDTDEVVLNGTHVSSDPAMAKLQEQFRFMVVSCDGRNDLSSTESLALVGMNKAIAYEPLARLRTKGPGVVDRLAEFAQRRGNVVLYLNGSESCGTAGGAMYVYNPEKLQGLIDANPAAMAEVNWPSNPEGFVRAQARTSAPMETHPNMYRLLAEAYTDPREQYRTPDYPALLTERDAFRAAGGLDGAARNRNDLGLAGG